MIWFPYGLTPGLTRFQKNVPPNRTDLLDFAGGNFVQSSRYIDPITKDFVVSSNNHLQGMNAVDQSVLLAISTTFNSSCQSGLGQNFGSIKIIPSQPATLISTCLTLLNQCLNFQISNGQIILQGNPLVQNQGNGQILISFAYLNTTSNTTVPVSFLQGNS